MPKLAAIDVGSNAIRLAIASADSKGRLDPIHNAREPIRLGGEVFADRKISNQRLVQALDAFLRFRRLINRHGVKLVRAVGTSALREATNRDYFINQIAKASEIVVEPISGEEEARLLHAAVAHNIDLTHKVALLVDIGGGSVEISLATQRRILVTESFTAGTVRLLQLLDQRKRGDKVFQRLAQEYVNAGDTRLKREIGEHRIGLCIATGGNVEAFGDLRVNLCGGKSNEFITTDELETILAKIESLRYEKRISKLKMRPDRADVIVPAGIVLQNVAKLAGVERIIIPRVGLKDGLLIDMVSKLNKTVQPLSHTQAIFSARLLGRKYNYDAQHSMNVSRFALELFDSTRRLHKLGVEEKTLLEVAALLHDIGYYVNMTDHHKHSYYLIKESPIIGLSDTQREIVASLARYHSRAVPKPFHKEYGELSPGQRKIVDRLSPLLRLAEALDHEHGARVRKLRIRVGKKKVKLQLRGRGDLLLERWALARNAPMFEKVYRRKITVG